MTCNQLRVVTPLREYHNFPAETYAVTGLHTITRLTHMHLLRENKRTAPIQRPTTCMPPLHSVIRSFHLHFHNWLLQYEFLFQDFMNSSKQVLLMVYNMCSLDIYMLYILFTLKTIFNPLTPNDHYRSRTAPLTSKRCILYTYSTNIGAEYFKHGIYSPFFSSKCSLFHNSNLFGSCIIHILYTGVLKLKKIIPASKG